MIPGFVYIKFLVTSDSSQYNHAIKCYSYVNDGIIQTRNAIIQSKTLE